MNNLLYSLKFKPKATSKQGIILLSEELEKQSLDDAGSPRLTSSSKYSSVHTSEAHKSSTSETSKRNGEKQPTPLLKPSRTMSNGNYFSKPVNTNQ